MKRFRSNGLFVSWIEYHGRSEGLARRLGVPSLYFGSTRAAIFRYFRYFAATLMELAKRRPSVVLVMQPPVVALLPVVLYSRIFSARIAADLHTGVFYDPKWRWAARLTLRLLGRRDIVIVTNEQLVTFCAGSRSQVLVLHDIIEDLEPQTRAAAGEGLGPEVAEAEYALVPVCYEYDEPIEQILEAARRTPQVRFVMTGRPPADLPKRAPANVVFTGYVSNEAYWSLVIGASCIVALTTEEDTMQRAGYEALCFGKSAVVSPTAVLRSYFGDAVTYAEPDAADIALAVRTAIERREAQETKTRTLREHYVRTQAEALETLRVWQHGSALTTGHRTSVAEQFAASARSEVPT